MPESIILIFQPPEERMRYINGARQNEAIIRARDKHAQNGRRLLQHIPINNVQYPFVSPELM